MKPRRFILIAFAGLGLALVGCSTVSTTPTYNPDPGPPVIRGTEPEHAPIKTKDIPDGESSLRHNQPD